jgi:GT2 family glycosyltransferase
MAMMSLDSQSWGSANDLPLPAREIRVSVIVAVHNRLAQLRQLLEALARQSLPPESFEVLVCDDGSSEDLSSAVSAIDGIQVVFLRQGRAGAGKARTMGLCHARGEIVAFTDSDCIPDERWLQALSDALQSPSVGLVGGRIDHRRGEFLVGRCLNFLMSSTLGAAGARDPRGLIHMQFLPRAGNLAVRRSLAEAVNGFSGTPYGEDIEFSDRVRELGTDIGFVPQAVVSHNDQSALAQVVCEAFQKGKARVRLTRHRRMHELVHAAPAGLLLYSLMAVALGLLCPSYAASIAIPGVVYLLLIGVLAIQGTCALQDGRAILIVPLCAVALHFGYGAGYLKAWFSPRETRVSGGADLSVQRTWNQ